MHEIENIAFGNVSLRLKNLPHLTSGLENSYSPRDASSRTSTVESRRF